MNTPPDVTPRTTTDTDTAPARQRHRRQAATLLALALAAATATPTARAQTVTGGPAAATRPTGISGNQPLGAATRPTTTTTNGARNITTQPGGGMILNFKEASIDSVLDELSAAAGFIVVKVVKPEGRVTPLA